MKEDLLAYILKQTEATPNEMAIHFGVSRQMIQRHLKHLLDNGAVIKIGRPPHVFYRVVEQTKNNIHHFSTEDQEFLNEHFIEITNTGEYLKGEEAFLYWCEKRKLPFEKTLEEYKLTLKKYLQYKQNGLISGKQKISSTKGFSTINLNDVFYLDFYAIERFGKTLLGKLIHFGKQSQSRKLLNEIVLRTKTQVEQAVAELNIDAVGYIPPTISRQLQIMTVLEQGYALPIPHVQLVKVKGEIVVPQKALSKLVDRIENTKQSIMVADKRKYKRVMLIDDAVGSGATLNETAGKLLAKEIAQEVYGLAITGSYKGFDVITEA
jgi:DNA-binding transcriptional ArsR family regulator